MKTHTNYRYELAVARALMRSKGVAAAAAFLHNHGWSTDTAVTLARGR